MLSPIQNIPLSQLKQVLYKQPNLELKNLGNLPETNGISYKMAALAGAVTSLGLSTLSGVIEAELLNALFQIFPNGPSNEWYQFLATVGLSLIVAGISRKTISHFSKIGTRARDRLFLPAVSVLGFDTAAWTMNKYKGLNNGYLGKVNGEHIFKGHIGKALMSEIRLGDIGSGISYGHAIGWGLTILYIIDILKPDFKPTLTAKKALKKVYDFSMKSKKYKYLGQALFGGLLVGISGIPPLVVAPSIYDVTKEHGKYALERVKAKAERFLNIFYKPKIT